MIKFLKISVLKKLLKDFYLFFKENLSFNLKSHYTSSLLKLFTGSFISFFITFFTVPVISRIYSPVEFGRFEVLLSFISILVIGASLKYENAIVLPDKKEKRDDLTLLCVFILIFSTFTLFIFLLTLGEPLMGLFDIKSSFSDIVFIIILFFSLGLYQIARFKFISEEKYSQLSKNIIINSVISNVSKIAFGSLNASFAALFFGHLTGLVVSFIYSLRVLLFKFRIRIKTLYSLFFEFKNFMLFDLPSVFFISISDKLPIFFIAKYHGAENVAFYAMAIGVIDAPLNMISKSIKEVFYKAAAKHSDNNALYSFFISNIKKLILISILPLLIIFLFSSQIVNVFLGSSWSSVAWIMEILIVAKVFNFVSSICTSTMRRIEKQDFTLIFSVLFFTLRLLMFYLCRFNFMHLLYAVSASAIFVYSIYILFTAFKLKTVNLNKY